MPTVNKTAKEYFSATNQLFTLLSLVSGDIDKSCFSAVNTYILKCNNCSSEYEANGNLKGVTTCKHCYYSYNYEQKEKYAPGQNPTLKEREKQTDIANALKNKDSKPLVLTEKEKKLVKEHPYEPNNASETTPEPVTKTTTKTTLKPVTRKSSQKTSTKTTKAT